MNDDREHMPPKQLDDWVSSHHDRDRMEPDKPREFAAVLAVLLLGVIASVALVVWLLWRVFG